MAEDTALIEALKEVIDPELMVNIVALGLVYDVEQVGAKVSVNMTLTETQAQKLNQITQGLKADSAQLAGSGSVIVNHKDALKFLIETAAVP